MPCIFPGVFVIDILWGIMKKIIKKDYIRYELSKNSSVYVKEKKVGRQVSASGEEAIKFITDILGDTKHTDQNGCPMWFTP